MKTIAYSALGRELEVFVVDPATGALEKIQSLTMPALVQEGWFSRDKTRLYLASSDSGPMAAVKKPDHFVQLLGVQPDGRLVEQGAPVRLGNRPLYVTLDADETHLLLAYNHPSDVTVHRILPDGGIGDQVPQQPIDFGPTVHQVRVTPPGNIVLVPACGHDPKGEIAGSLGLYSFEDGKLAPLARMLPDPERAKAWAGVKHGAQGFSARHVTFHPTERWMYLCVETQGEIRLYDYDDNHVSLEPRAIRSTLTGKGGRSSQMASAIHVHPNGRFVYIGNRAMDTEEVDGQRIFVGGVNDMAVFEIDQTTGEPTLIQQIDTLGIFPRTFGISAENKLMVVGNEEPRWVRGPHGIERVVPSLVVFRIGDDGKLTLIHKRDHADNGEICFWISVLTLPA